MWGGLKAVTLFATCIALVACQRAGRQTSSFDKEKPYYLATGSPSGTYVQLGNAIAEAAETKVHVIPCTTQGSIDNLRLLRTGNVSFALVQMDSLHDELFHAEESAQPETQQSAEEKQGILLVTFLYSEKMHLFVRPHFYLNSPADLHRIKDRRRVWLGPERSGTYRTAQRVLEASGLVDDEIKDFGHIRPQPESKARQHADVSEKQEEDLNWNTAAQRLLEPLEQPTALYAYFRTTAVPRRTVPNERRNPLNRHTSAQIVPCPGIKPMVSANTESRTSSEPQPGPKLDTDDLLKADANIVPLSPTVIGHLAEDKLYVETTIELNTYEHLKRGAPTVGVPTVLVTNVDRNGGAVLINTVIRQIENHKSQIEDAIGGIELDQLSTPLRDDTLLYAVHPGAQDHLSPKKYASVWLAVIGLIAGVLLAVVVRNPRWIRRKLAAGSYVFLLVSILGIMWFLLGLAMSETEGRLNPDFANISNALLNSLRFVTGQLREYRLMTHQGEILTWLALFLFPLLFGWLTSDVVKNLLQAVSAWLARVIQRSQARDAYHGLITLARLPKLAIDWIFEKPNGRKGAVVFVNWNERGEIMLAQLRKNPDFADRRIVMIRSSLTQSIPKDLRGIDIVDGDPITRATLTEAGVVRAALVIILASWARADFEDRRRNIDVDSADTKSVLAVMAIQSFCDELQRTSVLPMKVELHLTRYREEAENAAHRGKLNLTCIAA